MQAVDACE
uniref:Uncharacterized protein n=1 Tax=Arundo donax TaxID=35708 RepID=A0A0A9B4U6_ARUDO